VNTYELRMDPASGGMTWRDFVRTTPRFSIAIDGYVAREPRFDSHGPRANFNHHEHCDRLATRSTCAQILMAIRQGLFRTFSDEHGFHRAYVYANDCDQDVCLSWFLLSHPWLAENTVNPLLNRLVHIEDMLDCTAGAYPFSRDLPILGECAWIFEPYTAARTSGAIDIRSAERFSSIVEDVCLRISAHMMGSGRSIPLDVRYRRIGGGRDWVMIEETGAHARTGLFSDHINAFVAVRERQDGRYVYTIGRTSHFIPFDVPQLLTLLDAAEANSEHHWGGANTIGGSPRAVGSRLAPADVEAIIRERYP
jgi:hypothetical protein